MIWGRMAVKHSNHASEIQANPKRAAPVWLSGWPLVLPSAGVAIIAALLAAPRATEPSTVPQPVLRHREMNAEFHELEQQAAAARAQPLPFAIREVGEVYRRVGRTQFDGPKLLDDGRALGWQALVRAARAKFGDTPLLQLRAVQVQMFVNALSEWDKTGKPSGDLIELGGDFTHLAMKNRWRQDGRLVMSHEERWALGLLRWNSLARVSDARPFRLSRNVELVQLRYFFAHPPSDVPTPELRQRIIKRYSELDPGYPLEYARGVLATTQGQFELAAASFSRQLQAHPDGSYVARARNHLIWVTAHMPAVENGIEPDAPGSQSR